MSGGEWLRNFAPAMEEAAARQSRGTRKRVAIRLARIKQQFRKEQLRLQIEGFVVADRGGHLSRILKDPHTQLVRDVRTVQVIRVEALEGLGTSGGPVTEDNPFREVVYWHTLEGDLIARRDRWEEARDAVNTVEASP